MRPGQSGPRIATEKEQFHDRGADSQMMAAASKFQLPRPKGTVPVCVYPPRPVPRHVPGAPKTRIYRQGLAESCHPPLSFWTRGDEQSSGGTLRNT